MTLHLFYNGISIGRVGLGIGDENRTQRFLEQYPLDLWYEFEDIYQFRSLSSYGSDNRIEWSHNLFLFVETVDVLE